MNINKTLYKKAVSILKKETNLEEDEMEEIINLLFQLSQLMVENQWNIILQEIDKK